MDADTSRLHLQGFFSTNQSKFSLQVYFAYWWAEGGSRQNTVFQRQSDNYIGTIAQTTSSQKSRFIPNPAVVMSFFSSPGNTVKLKKLTQHALYRDNDREQCPLFNSAPGCECHLSCCYMIYNFSEPYFVKCDWTTTRRKSLRLPPNMPPTSHSACPAVLWKRGVNLLLRRRPSLELQQQPEGLTQGTVL